MESSESKKTNLEDLSKEELVNKCKSLIGLAQKAKVAKEALQQENNELKSKVQESPRSDAACEILEKLTEEKLQLVTQLEDLKVRTKQFEILIREDQEKIIKLETENTSYSRQVKRLEDENEQLHLDLATFETQLAELHKIGVQQKQQLLELEKSNGDSLRELQHKLAVSLDENILLKDSKESILQELQALKIIRQSTDNRVKDIEQLECKDKEFAAELACMQTTNEKLKEKVTLYHSKLKKFALTTKQIKEEKNQVLVLFKDYTEQIKQWKEQLHEASKQLIHLVHDLKNENQLLKQNDELSAIKNMLNDVQYEKALASEKAAKSNKELEGKLNLVKKELEVYKEEVVLKKKLIEETESECKQLVESKEEIRKLLERSSEEITRLTNINKFLEKELKENDLKTKEIEIYKDEIKLKQKLIEETEALCKEQALELAASKEEIDLRNEAIKEANYVKNILEEQVRKLEEKLSLINNELDVYKQEVALKQKLVEETVTSKEEIDKLNEAIKKANEKSSQEIAKLMEINRKLEEELKFQNEEETKKRDVEEIKANEVAKLNDIIKESKEKVDLLNNKLEVCKKELVLKQKLIEETQSECKSNEDYYNKSLLKHKEEIELGNKALKNMEEKSNEEINKLTKINEELKEDGEKISKELIATKEEVNKLNEALKEANDLKEKANKQTQQEVAKVNETLSQEIARLTQVNKELKEELNVCRQQLIVTQNLLEEAENKFETSTSNNDIIEKQLAEKSSEEIQRLLETNKALGDKYILLESELKSLRNNLNNPLSTDDNLTDDIKRDNNELLLEMNQMNQALKERGETISKLEAHCEEIKRKLQLYETQANKNVDSISEKEETIKSLTEELNSFKNNNEMAHLKTEIDLLKDKLNNALLDTSSTYAESETMSTSTISRTEEVNRLKDLEGSWEERYGKLRNLAVKLKAKIRLQTTAITDFERERDELLKKHANALKTMQLQIDNLQDNLDKVNAENKQYVTKLNLIAINISKDKQLLVDNEETISKLTKEVEKLTGDKQTVDTWKKQVGAKVQTLRKESEAKNVLIKQLEANVSKLEEELKQTKQMLDQTSTESKKNSVLNLEMQDYEKSVKELSQKNEKQKGEIANLQTQLDMQKTTTSALREQNKTLEERILEQEKLGNSSSLEVNSCKKTISKLEELLQQKEDKILDITKLLETAKLENEELSTELSKVISEHQKSFNTVKSERDQLRNQLLTVQQNLRDVQDVLRLREEELRGVKEDYESYKVRAQSVLKKSHNRDLGMEEKIAEELTTVKSQNSKLATELKEISDKFDKEQSHSEQLSKENNISIKKTKELENEVEELKSYNEQLGLKHQKTISEHAETIRNLKVHAETLSQCYRQQLSEQEVRHNREIIELQSRLDKAPSPMETVPVHPSMPREEGEGSESVESNPAPNNVHPIPLERLLDSKSDDEVAHLKKLLWEQETKVVHLTALLSDTEQDFAKHVQMNKVLKEEIRRQQRSVEREKHAENLEYLKNVVFKFVTLNSGDERTRLVPVLNTILKLSPEETQKLVMVAKGDPGIKGWASYLPTWSSPNKPQ